MFGFLGHWQAKQEVEANGEASGASRHFYIIAHIRLSMFQKSGHSFFDYDNVNVTKADRQNLNAGTDVAYNGNNNDTTYNLLNAFADIVFGGFTFIAKTYGYAIGGARGWRYTSIAALTPGTRKTRYLFARPEMVDHIGLLPQTNNSAQSAASNLVVSTCNFYLDQFPNLKAFQLNEGFATTLNLRFPKRLEMVEISKLASAVTINGVLPASVKWIIIGNCAGVTSINTLIAGAVNCESLRLSRQNALFSFVNTLTTLTGNLDISMMTLLKEFVVANPGLSTISMPTGKSDWVNIYIAGMPTPIGALSTARIDEIVLSPTLKYFLFITNSKTWARTFVDSDFSNVLAYWHTYQNSFTGNITLTTARASIKEFKTGNLTLRTGTQQNSHPAVNITGLTGATSIDLTGSNIDDLQLPVNTVCTILNLYDNKLDIATNPNIVTQINAMTALTTLLLGLNSNSNVEANVKGQTSTNGLGVNPSLSGLVNLVTLSIPSCKITGTLTLPNVNKITGLILSFNHNLTAIANLLSHTSMLVLTAYNCENLSFAITNVFTAINSILVSDTGITSINLTGKTTGSMNEFQCVNCDQLVSITFSATLARMVFGSPRSILGSGCALLTSITNMDSVSWNAKTFGINTWDFSNCALNITFTFGVNDFCPNQILIQNNGMSSANVDATINSLYTNRTKWNTYTIAKSMNIAGTNGAAGGIYQAPAGFVLGSNDGAPASAKEQLYVLVNNYAWTMTYN